MAQVRVPSTWLTSVWVSGLESWRGDVTLAAQGRRPDAVEVARWEPDGDGGWELVVRIDEPVGPVAGYAS